MPKPSAFVTTLRSRGIHGCEFRFDQEAYSEGLDVDHVAKLGKLRDQVREQLENALATTRGLLSTGLPRSKSTLTSRALHCSNFVNIVVRNRRARRDPFLGVVHCEFAADVPADYDHMFSRLRPSDPQQEMVLTVRVLDIHLQREGLDSLRKETLDALGRALDTQLLSHVESISDAFDVSSNYERPFDASFACSLIHIRFQGAEQSAEARSLIERLMLRQNHRDATDVDWEPVGAARVERIPVDKAFFDALEQGLSTRKSALKPARKRAAVNETHHLLIKADPVLRLVNGKVINLATLASMQMRANKQRVEAIMEDQFLEEYELDWGPSYADRIEKMKDNSRHQPLKWIFLVDDATGVFAAHPLPASELTIDSLTLICDAMWAGKHGLFRGRPKVVSLPIAYASNAARDAFCRKLQTRGIELSKPASGFGMPLHVLKAWCSASSCIQAWDRSWHFNYPAHMSMTFVRDWSFAHALSCHACAFFGDDAHRLAYGGGGFPSLTQIKVPEYAEVVSVGPVESFFRQWKAQCHPDFQSDFGEPASTRPG